MFEVGDSRLRYIIRASRSLRHRSCGEGRGCYFLCTPGTDFAGYAGRGSDYTVVDWPMMLKRALIAVLVLVVAVFFYIGYSGYDAGRSSTTSVSAASRSRTGEGQISVPSAELPAASPSGEMPASGLTPAQGAALDGAAIQGTKSGVSQAPGDTIQPNPPNGMTFGGSGHYQLYRQGNLTWRLNTDTGDSCVLLATEEEWRKPQVYRSGCRKHE